MEMKREKNDGVILKMSLIQLLVKVHNEKVEFLKSA